jgi:hypothetical protein
MRKPAYMSPAEVAQEMTLRHVSFSGCVECEGYVDDLCPWHAGYREGITILLLEASAVPR